MADTATVLTEDKSTATGTAVTQDKTTAVATTQAAGATTAAAATTTAAAGAAASAQTTTATATADAPKGDWPGDWVQKLSAGDDKRAQRLSRYASPVALADALIAAQNRIASGEVKAAFPKDGKPEEISAWRQTNGIPEAPDKYDLNLGNGLVVGADDKPIVDGFLKAAHGANMHPDQVKQTLNWYYEEQNRQAQVRAEQDAKDRIAALDTLNAEWGPSFRRNVNLIENTVIARFPPEIRDAIKSARLGNGKGMFNDPEVMRAFAALALEINPAGTVVPSGEGDPAKSVNDRIAELEKLMRTDRRKYNSDPKLSGPDGEYQKLLAAREKLNQRKAA